MEDSVAKGGAYQICFLFDWVRVLDDEGDYEDVEIVRVYQDKRLLDHTGKEIKTSSLLQEEIRQIGAKEFIGKDELNNLPAGRYKWKGTISYWCDYWGEWDCEIIGEITPANRKTKRANWFAKCNFSGYIL